MTDEFGEMSAAQRRLASKLRQLRRAADLTGEQLASRYGWNQSKVSRLETGKTVPRLTDVDAWLRAVGATPDIATEVDELLDAALTSTSPWKAELREGRRRKQERIGELEQSVSAIRVFQPDVVPGLLQIPDMIRHVYSMGRPVSDADLAQAVKARMDRQVVLYDRAKRLEFVMAEAALRWRPGPVHVQLAQLDRLEALTSAVRVGIIPSGQQVSAHHFHGFVILGEPGTDDDLLVLVETMTRELYLRDDHDVAAYLEQFGKLVADAVYGDEARAVLRRVATDLRSLQEAP